MRSEYEHEPVRGLPGNLPPGEAIVWQGSPDWRALAWSVFHVRLVAAWFVLVAGAAFVAGGTGLLGAVITMGVAIAGLALLGFLAWAQARTTVYTLTNRRIVMRFGVALEKAVNLPLKQIGSANLKPAGKTHVDIAFATVERFPLGWLQMWPHVRPWAIGRPQPMLRAVPVEAAAIIAKALADADPALVRPVAAAIRVVAAEPLLAPSLEVAA